MTSVFDQNTNKEPIASDPNASTADLLKSIVNDQGEPKYKTEADAIKALAHSQAHIKQLEDEAKAFQAEQTRLREEVASKASLEEVVKRLTEAKPAAVEPKTPENAGLSEEAIVKTLEQIVAKREAAGAAQANLDRVNSTLLTKFGEKTRTIVADKAKELGMTPQELGALSSKNPQLVLSLFGEKLTLSTPTTPSGTTPLNNDRQSAELKRPAKSLLSGSGATVKNQRDMMAEIRKKVYADLEVETV